MKMLPVGEQDFSKLRSEKWLYIDKTEFFYNLIKKAGLYFLSRPRRFGKSLTISTLKEILSGNKDLFKGLWIYDKYDFEKFPVIHIPFSSLDYYEKGLEKAISDEMLKIAEKNDIKITEKTYSAQFRQLIEKMGNEKPVAILIDEYDKPIVDYIDDRDKSLYNRKVLKNFYSSLKDLTYKTKMLFITGVSKFSGVSIFSDLNNLHDLTFDNTYSTMLGYTQEELEKYFEPYFPGLIKKYNINKEQLLEIIKEWYNGYSWDGKNFVYNPFSILELFAYNEFGEWWFRTGTPTFLMKVISEKNYSAFDLENRNVHSSVFEKHDIDSIEINSLLLQTGYLTIKEKDLWGGRVTLDYPNREVESTFTHHLLAEFTRISAERNSSWIFDMIDALNSNDIEDFINVMQKIFRSLTYPNIDKTEKYFHSIFYLIVKLIGFSIDSEIATSRGRIDCALFINKKVYIIEFKVGSADSAIKQIEDKAYADKFKETDKKIILFGIGFDKEKREISDWKIKTVA